VSEKFVRHLELAQEAFLAEHSVEPLSAIHMPSQAVRRLAYHFRGMNDRRMTVAGVPILGTGRDTRVEIRTMQSTRGSKIYFEVTVGDDLLESVRRREDLTRYVVDAFNDKVAHAVRDGFSMTLLEFAYEHLSRMYSGVHFSKRDLAERMMLLYAEVVDKEEGR
jgi:hypothetical protein